jgi:hypothetical protein
MGVGRRPVEDEGGPTTRLKLGLRSADNGLMTVTPSPTVDAPSVADARVGRTMTVRCRNCWWSASASGSTLKDCDVRLSLYTSLHREVCQGYLFTQDWVWAALCDGCRWHVDVVTKVEAQRFADDHNHERPSPAPCLPPGL